MNRNGNNNIRRSLGLNTRTSQSNIINVIKLLIERLLKHIKHKAMIKWDLLVQYLNHIHISLSFGLNGKNFGPIILNDGSEDEEEDDEEEEEEDEEDEEEDEEDEEEEEENEDDVGEEDVDDDELLFFINGGPFNNHNSAHVIGNVKHMYII